LGCAAILLATAGGSHVFIRRQETTASLAPPSIGCNKPWQHIVSVSKNTASTKKTTSIENTALTKNTMSIKDTTRLGHADPISAQGLFIT
jgi:hypothetical protein